MKYVFAFQYQMTLKFTAKLDHREIWSSYDWPEHPTVEDVQKVVRSSGGAVKILDDWNFLRYLFDEANGALPKVANVKLKIVGGRNRKRVRRKRTHRSGT